MFTVKNYVQQLSRKANPQVTNNRTQIRSDKTNNKNATSCLAMRIRNNELKKVNGAPHIVT